MVREKWHFPFFIFSQQISHCVGQWDQISHAKGCLILQKLTKGIQFWAEVNRQWLWKLQNFSQNIDVDGNDDDDDVGNVLSVVKYRNACKKQVGKAKQKRRRRRRWRCREDVNERKRLESVQSKTKTTTSTTLFDLAQTILGDRKSLATLANIDVDVDVVDDGDVNDDNILTDSGLLMTTLPYNHNNRHNNNSSWNRSRNRRKFLQPRHCSVERCRKSFRSDVDPDDDVSVGRVGPVDVGDDERRRRRFRDSPVHSVSSEQEQLGGRRLQVGILRSRVRFQRKAFRPFKGKVAVRPAI